MEISIKKLDALVRATFNYSELRRLFRTELNEALDQISSPTNHLPDVVLDILEWCQRNGRLKDFALAAVRMREHHPDWKRVGWELNGELAPTTSASVGSEAIVHIHGRSLAVQHLNRSIADEQMMRVSGSGIRIEFPPS